MNKEFKELQKKAFKTLYNSMRCLEGEFDSQAQQIEQLLFEIVDSMIDGQVNQ